MPEIVAPTGTSMPAAVVRISSVEFQTLSPEKRDALLKSSIPTAHIVVDQMTWGDIIVTQLFHTHPPYSVRKSLETCLLKFVEHVMGQTAEAK